MASPQPRRALGFVTLLAADGRACAGGDGGQRYAWKLRPRQARRHAEPDTAPASEFQEPAEFQGPWVRERQTVALVPVVRVRVGDTEMDVNAGSGAEDA